MQHSRNTIEYNKWTKLGTKGITFELPLKGAPAVVWVHSNADIWGRLWSDTSLCPKNCRFDNHSSCSACTIALAKCHFVFLWALPHHVSDNSQCACHGLSARFDDYKGTFCAIFACATKCNVMYFFLVVGQGTHLYESSIPRSFLYIIIIMLFFVRNAL